jgi:hypothetical protein
VITNTGTATATDVMVTLAQYYNRTQITVSCHGRLWVPAGRSLDDDSAYVWPAIAWLDASTTMLSEVPSTREAMAVPLPTSVALLERSTRSSPGQVPAVFPRFVTGHGQPSMRHHRECDMSAPTVPMTHFTLIQ